MSLQGTIWAETALPIVVTFDNLPLNNTISLSGEEKKQKLLQALKGEQIEAAFFIVGEELDKKSAGQSTLEEIMGAGHRIANHSFTHPHLTEIALEDYLADVMQCDKLINQLSLYRPWFRYPYLDIGMNPPPMEGASLEKAIGCAQTLKEKGIKNAYVTIDSYDWFLNTLLLKAIADGKSIDQKDLEAFYLDHLQKAIPKYLAINQSKKFSAHVILFHSNADITALCLPCIITMLRENGWQFAAPEKAFNTTEKDLADFDAIIQQAKLTRIKPSDGGKTGYLNKDVEITSAFQRIVLHE